MYDNVLLLRQTFGEMHLVMLYGRKLPPDSHPHFQASF